MEAEKEIRRVIPNSKFAEQSKFSEDLLCDNHSQKLVGFCNSEKLAICAQCVKDNCRNRHDLIELAQAGQHVKENLYQSFQLLRPIEQKLSNMNLLLNETHKEFQKIGNHTLNDILSFFTGVRETIFQYQTKVIEYWKILFEDERGLLTEQETKVNSQLTDIELVSREIANMEHESYGEIIKKAKYRYGLVKKAAKDVSFKQRVPNLPEFRNDKAFLALWKRLRNDYTVMVLEKKGDKKRGLSPNSSKLETQKNDVELIEELFRGTTATAHVTNVVKRALEKISLETSSDSQVMHHDSQLPERSPGKKWLSEQHLLDHLRGNTAEDKGVHSKLEERKVVSPRVAPKDQKNKAPHEAAKILKQKEADTFKNAAAQKQQAQPQSTHKSEKPRDGSAHSAEEKLIGKGKKLTGDENTGSRASASENQIEDEAELSDQRKKNINREETGASAEQEQASENKKKQMQTKSKEKGSIKPHDEKSSSKEKSDERNQENQQSAKKSQEEQKTKAESKEARLTKSGETDVIGVNSKAFQKEKLSAEKAGKLSAARPEKVSAGSSEKVSGGKPEKLSEGKAQQEEKEKHKKKEKSKKKKKKKKRKVEALFKVKVL